MTETEGCVTGNDCETGINYETGSEGCVTETVCEMKQELTAL